ncbi:MAG: hypothetical protein M3Y76_05170, partial [Chloroflexota bacterium]|nr:hypothetical protein [Chloroflexota bacterium]
DLTLFHQGSARHADADAHQGRPYGWRWACSSGDAYGMTLAVILAPVPDRYISGLLDYIYYNENINRGK